MRNFTFCFFFLFITSTSFCQWTTFADVMGDPKNHPITFAIDEIGYSITGYNTINAAIYDDAYTFDPATNQWTQAIFFDGGNRGFAVGAAYDGKGYAGFGVSNVRYENDIWEYDPTTDTWTELTTCPCLGRRHPAFAITDNGKIYVGLGDGFDANGDFRSGFSDFWEYDIPTDTWKQLPDLPGPGRHHPYYFAIGDVMYTGFGHGPNGIYNDFYKYDSNTEQWTVLNDFPGESRVAGAQFAYDGFGYIVDGEGSDHRNLNDGEFYRYDPTADTWTQLSSHIGDGLWAPGAFVIGDMVYVTGGDDDDDNSLSTLWAYSLNENRVDDAIVITDNTHTLENFYDEDATFQWVDCANNYAPLPNETAPFIEITPLDSFALIVTYSAGGVDTSACYTGELMSSVSEEDSKLILLDIYPNPVSDNLTINLRNDYSGMTIEIIDVLGKQVLNSTIERSRQDVNLSQINSGLYSIIVRNRTGEILESAGFMKM